MFQKKQEDRGYKKWTSLATVHDTQQDLKKCKLFLTVVSVALQRSEGVDICDRAVALHE